MPGQNLTRIEAQERAAALEVQSYQVEIDLTQGAEFFGSTTRVRFTSKTPGISTFIDAITNSVHSVVLNGEVLDPAVVSDGIRIQLPSIAAENELVWNKEIAQLARQHNDANVIAVGARQHSKEEVLELIKIFIAEPFSMDERHERRIGKIGLYEQTGEIS